MKKLNFVLTGALAAALIFPGTALGSTVKVKRGDTLSEIAVANKTTVSKIKTINNLKSNMIYVGQILETGTSSSTQKVTTTATKGTGTVIGATYLNVRSGPGVSYKSIGSIKKGTKVTIHSQKNGWYNITTGNKKGYASSKYISTNKTTTVSINTTTAPGKTNKVFNKPTEGTPTSNYGDRNGKLHSGIDFAKPGNVQIKSAEAGTVSKSFIHSSYGEVVFIKHKINGVNYETVYAHMRKGSRTVKVGQRVKAGYALGWMGSTGHSTGQHLHFEIHKGDWNPGRTNSVDPLKYMK